MSAFEHVGAGLDVTFDLVPPLAAALGEHLHPVTDPLFPRIGMRLSLVSDVVPLVSVAVTLIGDPVALISDAVTPVGDLIAPARRVTVLVLVPL